MEGRQEQPLITEPTLSSEQRDQIRQDMLLELGLIIQTYEPFYTKDEQPKLAPRSLTKERYARFEAWVGKCAETGQCAPELDQNAWTEDTQRIVIGYRALAALKQPGTLPSDLQAYCETRKLMPGEFRMLRSEVPTWERLPSEDDLKKLFRLDSIENTYSAGRTVKRFTFTERELSNAGMRGDQQVDQNTVQDLLERFKRETKNERLPPARILDVKEILEAKKRENRNHPDDLSLWEVFTFLDAQKLRPATLQELLAYAKSHWHTEGQEGPAVDPNAFIKTDVPHIHALGSVFGKKGYVASLRYINQARDLDVTFLHNRWSVGDLFLVFRQE